MEITILTQRTGSGEDGRGGPRPRGDSPLSDVLAPVTPLPPARLLPWLWGPSPDLPPHIPPAQPAAPGPPCLPRGAGLPGAPRGPGCAPRCSWPPGAGGTPRPADSRAGRGAGVAGRPSCRTAGASVEPPGPGPSPPTLRVAPGSMPLWLLESAEGLLLGQPHSRGVSGSGWGLGRGIRGLPIPLEVKLDEGVWPSGQ